MLARCRWCGLVLPRFPVAEQHLLDEVDREREVFLQRREQSSVARQAVVRRHIQIPRQPRAVVELGERGVAVREERACIGLLRVIPHRERCAGRSRELPVHLAHDGERILVHPAPDVETVLLDPVCDGLVAAARALAAKSPSELVDRDVERVGGWGIHEAPRRRHAAAPSAKYRDAPSWCGCWHGHVGEFRIVAR